MCYTAAHSKSHRSKTWPRLVHVVPKARTRIRKIFSAIGYLLYLISIVVAFDVLVLKGLLGFGYPSHYEEENVWRYPAPYVEFTGKPNVRDHNDKGFRGLPFEAASAGALKIAIFGGSTGYFGNPTIAQVLEQRLEESTGESVFVANFSVVSSNHRQHLHGILEFLPRVRPDINIFYGGHNETITHENYDPRPGYPYNFFYRSETNPALKVILENSALIGEFDKRAGYLTGLSQLKAQEEPLSPKWRWKIVNKYFETLRLASKVSGTIESGRFGRTMFMAFYQPYLVPQRFADTHMQIRKMILKFDYVHDVSSAYDELGDSIYVDQVHVKQKAKYVMGEKVARIVERVLE